MKNSIKVLICIMLTFYLASCKKDLPTVGIALSSSAGTSLSEENIALAVGSYTLVSKTYFDAGGDPKYYRQINANKEVEISKPTDVNVTSHGVERGVDFENAKIENNFITLGLKKGDKLILSVVINPTTTATRKSVTVNIQ